MPRKQGQLTVMSLTEAQRSAPGDALWVLNNTVYNDLLENNPKPGDKSNVIFSMRSNNGEVHTVPVFVSWVPTCLSEIVPKDTLLRSQNFMRAVNLGKLVIIDEQSAQKILSIPGALQEQERVRRLDINSATGDALGAIGETADTAVKVEGTEVAAQEPTVNPTVISYLELMETGTGMEALNSLRSLGKLSNEELSMVISKAKSLGEDYRPVVEYARGRLGTKKAE